MIPLWWERSHSVSICLYFQKAAITHSDLLSQLQGAMKFFLIRDGNHIKWDFALDSKKSRKGQHFWRNTHAFVYFAPAKRGGVVIHDFVLNLWILLLKEIQGKWPSCGESDECCGWQKVLAPDTECGNNQGMLTLLHQLRWEQKAAPGS